MKTLLLFKSGDIIEDKEKQVYQVLSCFTFLGGVGYKLLVLSLPRDRQVSLATLDISWKTIGNTVKMGNYNDNWRLRPFEPNTKKELIF